ncbi:hemagglutinin repeat-containing protein [Escherichia coli]
MVTWTIQGRKIKAGVMLLQANRDVNLVSAENTSKLEGDASQWRQRGCRYRCGAGGPGFSLSASVNQG